MFFFRALRGRKSNVRTKHKRRGRDGRPCLSNGPASFMHAFDSKDASNDQQDYPGFVAPDLAGSFVIAGAINHRLQVIRLSGGHASIFSTSISTRFFHCTRPRYFHCTCSSPCYAYSSCLCRSCSFSCGGLCRLHRTRLFARLWQQRRIQWAVRLSEIYGLGPRGPYRSC